MNNAILLQQVLSNSPYRALLELTFARHARYCLYAKMDYRVEISGEADGGGGWGKVHLIKRALKEYEYVIWLDADAVIWDVGANLRSCCQQPINAVELPLPFPHLNVGVLFFRAGEEAVAFVDDWLAGYPGLDIIHEQGTFQMLCGGEKHNAHVGVLPARCNSVCMLGTGCDDPVVKAWHGHAGHADVGIVRELMEKALAECKSPNWIGV